MRSAVNPQPATTANTMKVTLPAMGTGGLSARYSTIPCSMASTTEPATAPRTPHAYAATPSHDMG